MEGPMSSSVSKSYLMNSNIVVSEEEEESGWTDYLDDFSCSNNDNNGGSFVSDAPSLISDAAWNGSDKNNNNNISPPLRILNLKRNFKHRKYSYGDDDLEDTASSPVNSPKVSTMKQMEVNYRRLDDLAAGNFLGKQATTSNFSEVVTEEKNEKNNNNIGIESRNNNIDDQFIDDLRKKGLCLVPISALMNYLG